MNLFYEASDEKYKENLKVLLDEKNAKKIFSQNYLYQEGFKILKCNFKNKTIFMEEELVIMNLEIMKFSCSSEILAVLADGNVVPLSSL